jgi:hypothetical protein
MVLFLLSSGLIASLGWQIEMWCLIAFIAVEN